MQMPRGKSDGSPLVRATSAIVTDADTCGMAHLDAQDAPQGTQDEPQSAAGDTESSPPPASPLLRSTTVSRGTFHQCGAGRRVKLYALEEDAWADRGTGYCAGVYDEEMDDALIVVRREENCESLGAVEDAENAKDDAPYMVVVSDNLDSEEFLLRTSVAKEDVYQRQQDTLIVWTEPSGTDLALSFQELEGCSEVWDFLSEVQRHYSAAEHSENNSAAFSLPEPDFSNLEEIEAQLVDAVGQGSPMRERVIDFLVRNEYIVKLSARFADAEALEVLDTLHQLYAIMEVIVTISDYALVEQLLQESVYMSVVGMLECAYLLTDNPKYPTQKASYREFLQEETQFRQVVEISDPVIIAKIHKTYRLVYLKDVVLGNILDDAAFSMLNTLTFFYKSDIVSYFASDDHALAQISAIFSPEAKEDMDKRREAILFLHQLCTMAKQVPLQARLTLFHSLVRWDLLVAVEFALRQTGTTRAAAIEILMETIEYDAPSVQHHVLSQIEHGQTPLVSILIDLLLESPDPATKAQMAEAVRVLFDSSEAAPRPDRFLTWLYESDMERLFAPVQQLPELGPAAKGSLLHLEPLEALLCTLLCDLLGFAIAHHSFRSQYFVHTNGVLPRVSTLLHARDKHMQLAALRLFRACFESSNQQMHRHLADTGVLSQLLRVLEREAPRDNLVSSACLGLFDYLRRGHVRSLVNLLIESHREQMERMSADPVAGPCISALLRRPDTDDENRSPQSEAAANDSADEEQYFASEEAAPSLVPYDEADEHEDADEAALDSVTLGMRRRRDADDDDLASRVAKRKHVDHDAAPQPLSDKRSVPPGQAAGDAERDAHSE